MQTGYFGAVSFNLFAHYKPKGDQPEAIRALVAGVHAGQKAQTLLGVTGSGKTFTMANVIRALNRPTLVLSHNKTLAAQLYTEFRNFFPENAVEYFVSYYDYYQPEAYIPATGKYIEKELAINQEIKARRLSTIFSLLSGRRDVIVVSSVSCIYGMTNPLEMKKFLWQIRVGALWEKEQFLEKLVALFYHRTKRNGFEQGSCRIRDDSIEVFLPYEYQVYRFCFLDNVIQAIYVLDPESEELLGEEEEVILFPANQFVTNFHHVERAIAIIEEELDAQVRFFLSKGCQEEAERLEERTRLDIEMIRELGYCPGIENYSRCFDGRAPGVRPYCIIDYFPKDFLLFADESHVSIPQISGMFGGDRARKNNLVDHGFRIPAALDNRPLTLGEFESLINQVIYVSATPADYELAHSEGIVVEQLVRPTGLLDPVIKIHPTKYQIDHLLHAIKERTRRNERVLVITLTKKMAEKLAKYLEEMGVRCQYIHSEIKTLHRMVILENLRTGVLDVLVGVNLLREGLDLPEVSLVAILDADKEGFLRNTRSLIQIIGRAARHVSGTVLLYADKVTPSMERAIEETTRRRKKQENYNRRHNIVPTSVEKKKQVYSHDTLSKPYKNIAMPVGEAAEAQGPPLTLIELKKAIKKINRQINQASAAMDYTKADRLQKELKELESALVEKNRSAAKLSESL